VARSVLEKTGDELRAKRTYRRRRLAKCNGIKREPDTCVAMYAIDESVMQVIPWIRAFPERVALGSFSTELGEVNICL
jgi:hypothetical protein